MRDMDHPMDPLSCCFWSESLHMHSAFGGIPQPTEQCVLFIRLSQLPIEQVASSRQTEDLQNLLFEGFCNVIRQIV